MSDILTARAPATPLIVHDPFMSVWSTTDELTQSWPTHWSGQNQTMCGMLRIDGKPFRFMGLVSRMGTAVPAMTQTRREITPTSTTYLFEAAGVGLEVSFLTPSLPDDLELMARPLSYVTLSVQALDGASHEVSAYIDWTAKWVADPETEIIWGRHRAGPVEAMFMGAAQQTPLGRSGDQVQIDWGYLYTSPEPGSAAVGAFGDALSLRERFIANGSIPERDDVRDGEPLAMPAHGHRGPTHSPDRVHQDRPGSRAAAWSQSFGTVGEDVTTFRVAVAYDQVFSIAWLERRLRPFWRRNGQSAIGLIEQGWADRADVTARAAALDKSLVAQLTEAGGDTLARLGILAFRQCLGGHALVADVDGSLLHFSKENSSNGCLGTVDLTYPSAPFFLHFNPALLEAQMRPIFIYSASGRWRFPFAPHDVGQFPLANGQVYGGGALTEDDQMPYEESGNMLILTAALVQATDDDRVAREYWPLLEAWAVYLAEQGLDPENQLCTDDFSGHLPHNANLSLKAIIGLGAFAHLCRRLGKNADADHYQAIASSWAGRWPDLAGDATGATRLAFDMPGTWSQKYNLIWDRILGLGLFPDALSEAEAAGYRQRQDRYGLPLDSRRHYTKLDWLVWSACLSGSRADLDALLQPVGRWLDETETRIPLSDWFDTETGRQPGTAGFYARPVVGGVFMPLYMSSRKSTP